MSEISVPPRKRRRPALSCVECRRRKIKCDRRMPCSHCMQLKSTLCTYPETHSNVVNRRNVPKPLPNPLSVNRPLGSPGGNDPTSLPSEGQSSDRNPLPDLGTRPLLPLLMTVLLRRMFRISSVALEILKNTRLPQGLLTSIPTMSCRYWAPSFPLLETSCFR
jgi:hypothetical protein